MTQIKLSIIIPAYNIENYLARCLDSIINQTFSDYEVIVVNDGSKDNSGAIADKYAKADSRIKVIHKENGGVSSARITGIKSATGEFIGFVDGDDIVEPNMFETLINNADRYSADISHCGYKMVFPDGRTDYYYDSGKFVEQDNFVGLKDLLEGKFIEPGLVNKIYKASIVKSIVLNNVVDPSIKINEDLLMNYYLFKNANISIYEDKCLYHYMVHKNSAATSAINKNKLCDPIKVMNILNSETSDDIRLNKIVMARYARILIQTATLNIKQDPELIEPERAKARKELRRLVGSFIRNDCVNTKLKLMCLWTAISPQTYSLFHRIYARVSGIDKKFAVD